MFPLTKGVQARMEATEALLRASEASGPARDHDLHAWLIHAISLPNATSFRAGFTGLLGGSLGTYFFLREDWEAAYLACVYGGIFRAAKSAIEIEREFAYTWAMEDSRPFAGVPDDAYFQWLIGNTANRVRKSGTARSYLSATWQYALKARFAGREEFEYLSEIRDNFVSQHLALLTGSEPPGEPIRADVLSEHALQCILADSWENVRDCVRLFRGEYGEDRVHDLRPSASKPLFQALEAWLKGRDSADRKERQQAMKKALAGFMGHLAQTIFSSSYYLHQRNPAPRYSALPKGGMPEPLLMYAMVMRLDLGDDSDTAKSFVYHFRPFLEVFPFLQARLASLSASTYLPTPRPLDEVVDFYNVRIRSHMWEFFARRKDQPAD